jgi:SpoVK/Ycf46/Vps4 family AAA+-type ATPase
MELLVENVDAVPSYNGYVITELDDMTAGLDQYWNRRKASYAATVERLKLLVTDADAERVWREYCRRRTTFLRQLVKAGSDSGERAFQTQLHWKTALAREARALFQKDAWAEIWVPVSHYPLRLVRTPGHADDYDVVDYPGYDGTDLVLGKPIVAVSWRNRDLFLLLPSLEFVALDTFVIAKDQANWNTEESLPTAFALHVARFNAELSDAEQSFAPLRRSWGANHDWRMAAAQLAGVDRAAALWERVHIPEHQKLELLRRIELFEAGDPAAPTGLLLKGPSGTGKTWIVKTLAETIRCHCQLLSLPDFKEPNLGGSAQRVRQRWQEARSNQPSIMFVDDCEGVLVRRGALEADKIGEEIVEAFLPEWDGVQGRSRVLLIGASNRPKILDDAVISRFGWEMEINLPDSENREKIFTQEMHSMGTTTEIPSNIGQLTQGMSGRDLHHLASSIRALATPDEPRQQHILEAVTSSRRLRSTSFDRSAVWDSLILDDGILERLKVICTLLKEADKWRAHGVSIPGSLLLIGASGVGKTRAARTIAAESGLNFLAPSTAQVKAAVLGGSANQVQQLFERGRAMAPVIIFLDKLDVVAPKQSQFDAKDRLTEEIAAQLQQEMNGVQAREGQVFLMAATHDPQLVEESVLNCFQERVVLPPPNRELRQQLLTLLLTGKRLGFPLREGSRLLSDLIDGSEVSGGYLENWIKAAEQKALSRAIQTGGPEHLLIQIEDFESFAH